MIDFQSDESMVLLNPRMPPADRADLLRDLPALGAHLFVATSGSTGRMKLVALSKEAILASAAAVNERFEARPRDVWAAVLPEFHVGGVGVQARAYLSGARVVAVPWSVDAFIQACQSESVTLVSLVPAQVVDLVHARARPAKSMRAALVGGGAFDGTLAAQARALGWPVLASYGSSECASTIAVESSPGAGDLRVLPHLNVAVEENGCLSFGGPALFTGYVIEGCGLIDPKVNGRFVSEDLGNLDADKLELLGRLSDFVKIGGESVDLSRLDAIVMRIAGPGAAVAAIPDERLGAVIHLFVTGDGDRIRDAFNELVLPFEKPREVHLVAEIPWSPLGKVLRQRLVAMVRAPR